MKKILFNSRNFKGVNAVIFVLCILFSSHGKVCAEEPVAEDAAAVEENTAISKPSVSDKIIGATFKMLAKSFVRVMDIEKLKKNNIAKIEKMNEGKFEKRRSKIYSFTKNLPENIRKSYAITPDVSRQEVITQIKLMDKRAFYEIIDKVPDQVIAGYFRQEILEGKEKLAKSNTVEEIRKFWSKVTNGAYDSAATKEKEKC